MYCSKCKGEYLDGIETCPDCNVKLVVQLTDECKEKKEINPIKVKLVPSIEKWILPVIIFILIIVYGWLGMAILVTLFNLLCIGVGMYVVYLIIQVMRIYIKKNS